METINEELDIQRVVNIINKYYEESKKLTDLKISKKERNDIVTEIDLFMEKNIIRELSKLYPTYSFQAEESGETKKNSGGDFYQWIIDPIDGTVNFAAGLPDFGVVVALQKNGETILGVTVLPKLGEVYTGIKGKGAYCNGEKLSVSNNDDLSNCVVMVYLGEKYNENVIARNAKLIEKLATKCRGVRIVGSSSVASCQVAKGNIDAIINLKENISFGSTAGRLFISEAGGMVTNILGKERQKVDTMVCSNGLIHKKILKIIDELNKTNDLDNFFGHSLE